jgi:hypothetical protein
VKRDIAEQRPEQRMNPPTAAKFASRPRLVNASAPPPGKSRLFTVLCWLQGGYYFATGIWPIVNVRSFEAVTGEKTDNLPTGLEADHWLLMTVSVLIMSVAVTLLLAALRRTQTLEIGVLAIAAAVALTSIDVIYTLRRVIPPIYLLDAAIEVPLIAAWCWALIAQRRLAPAAEART